MGGKDQGAKKEGEGVRKPAKQVKTQAQIRAGNVKKQRAFDERAGDIGEIPAIVNPARRESCRLDFERFAMTYFPHLCYRPFNQDQKRVVKKTEKAVLKHGRDAHGMFRGGGKTTIAEIGVMWATVYGHRKWCLIVGATDPLAAAILKDIMDEFEDNELLMQDFPEVCYCWRNLEGRYQRAASQSYHGELTKIKARADRLIMPDIPQSVCAGSIISVVSITGATRGLKKGSQRPDFLFIDDAQTDESAASEEQTDKREKKIQGSLLGLAGHDKAISAVMTVTVIEKGDLTSRYLDHDRHPDWDGYLGKLVYKWPPSKLWEEYEARWKADNQAGDGEAKTATALYSDNRVEMDTGALVADENLFDKGFELSAIQHAYNLRLQMGDTFWAEYQGEPVSRQFQYYDLEPKLVSSRVNKLAKWSVPQDARIITGFSDVNHMAMKWAVIAFAPGPTGYIIGYGKHPERGVLVKKNASDAEAKKALAGGIHALVESVSSVPVLRGNVAVKLRGFGIDRGYKPEIVHPVTMQIRAPFPIIPCRGFPAAQYRGTGKNVVGAPGNNCHMTESQYGQFFAANVDAFKEAVQRGFLVAPGMPGSLSFYDGRKGEHDEISQELCAETMIGKTEVAGGTFGVFREVPNRKNDWLDAVVGAWALAVWFFGGSVNDENIKTDVPQGRASTGRRPVPKRRVCQQELTQ